MSQTSHSNTATATKSNPTASNTNTTSSSVVSRCKDKIEPTTPDRTAPSPRPIAAAALATRTAASSNTVVEPRFKVQYTSVARPISRSFSSAGSTVEPGNTAVPEEGVKPQRVSCRRLDVDVPTAVCQTTAKARGSASTRQLRLPKVAVSAAAVVTAAAREKYDGVNNDAASDASSSVEATESVTSEKRRLSVASTDSNARSSTTCMSTRQRRLSGLSPGLYTTVVNRKVYMSDGREHPSWKAEPRRRASSAAAIEHRYGNRTSSAPSSRRSSMADASLATGPLSRTVTPIRKA